MKEADRIALYLAAFVLGALVFVAFAAFCLTRIAR